MGSPQPLTPESIQELSRFLAAPERPEGTLRYGALRGLLFAIANAPVLQLPSTWFARVFGEGMEWPSEEVATSVLGTMMAVWNDIVSGSEDGEFEEAWLLGAEAASDEARAEWSHGFSLGYDMVREEWDELAALFEEEDRRQFDFVQMTLHFWSDMSGFYEAFQIAEAEERETLRKRFEARTLESAQYYALLGTSIARARARHRSPTQPLRAEQGPGRNDPCPCGSGKKYKKCCMV